MTERARPRRGRGPLLLVGFAVAACLLMTIVWIVGALLLNRDEDGVFIGFPSLPFFKGTVTVARYPSLAPVAFTLSRGILESRGYTVQVIEAASASEAAGLLSRGEADLTWLPPAQAGLLLEQDRPLQLLAPCYGHIGSVLASATGDIAVPPDLTDKRLAGVVTSQPYAATIGALSQRGIGPIRQVPVPEAQDAATVLTRGDADAIVAPSPADLALAEDGRFRVLDPIGRLWQPSGDAPIGGQECAWVGTRAAIDRLGGLRNDLADAGREVNELVVDPASYPMAMGQLGVAAEQATISRRLLGEPPPLRYTRAAREALLVQLAAMRNAGYLRTDRWLNPSQTDGFFAQ